MLGLVLYNINVIYILCLRSTHHASCSSWCRFVPISLTGGVTFAAVSRDRTGRYLRDSSVRRGAFPGLGPPGPCSFSLSRQHSPANLSIVLVLEFEAQLEVRLRAHLRLYPAFSCCSKTFLHFKRQL